MSETPSASMKSDSTDGRTLPPFSKPDTEERKEERTKWLCYIACLGGQEVKKSTSHVSHPTHGEFVVLSVDETSLRSGRTLVSSRRDWAYCKVMVLPAVTCYRFR